MLAQHTDLSALSRAPGAPAAPRDAPVTTARGVPPPRWKWRTRVLLPGVVLGGAAALLLYAARDALTPAVPVRVVPVVAKAMAGTSAAGIRASSPAGNAKAIAQAAGWVEADPYSYAVSALADGVVRDVLVLEGERVEVGQVVARLIDEDARLLLAQAEAEVAQREAMSAAAEAAATAAQTDWDHPVEATRKLGKAGADLAQAQAELDRWPSELAAEVAKAHELEAELLRVRNLAENRQTSDIELIRVEQQYESQKATAESMRLKRPMLEAQTLGLTAERDAAREALSLRTAERRALDESKAGVAQAQAMQRRAEAMRDEAKLRLARMEVRSLLAGVVMSRLVEPGSKLMQISDNMRSAQVLRLYDPDRLQVRVDVPLADAARVGVGQPAEIVVNILPDRMFRGRVTRIVHEADLTRNTLQVKVAIEKPAPELKPEMLARVKFFAATPEPTSSPGTMGAPSDNQPGTGATGLFVPESLVRHSGDEAAHVWLVDQGRGVAELRPVVVGRMRIGSWIEVAEGLQPGDRLIADAPADLKTGQRVRVIGEAADADGAGGGMDHIRHGAPGGGTEHAAD